jgi:Protein of unknown function (DUF3592)
MWFRYALRHSLLPVLLLLLIGTSIGTVIIYSLLKTNFQFRREGVEAEATVLDKSRTRAKKSWNNKVVYQFTGPDGNVIEAEDAIPDGPWAGLKKGSRMPILYLRSDPSKSRANFVSSEDRIQMGTIGIIAGCAVAGLALLGVLFSMRGLSKRIRLVRTGERTLATVKEFLAEYGVVVYEYRDDAGQPHEGREQAPRGICGAKDPGETFVVLYDPRKPQRHEIDRYSLRSDA